jgi:hypothetical protein
MLDDAVWWAENEFPSFALRKAGRRDPARRLSEGQSVHDHANLICPGKVRIAEFANANGEV